MTERECGPTLRSLTESPTNCSLAVPRGPGEGSEGPVETRTTRRPKQGGRPEEHLNQT